MSTVDPVTFQLFQTQLKDLPIESVKCLIKYSNQDRDTMISLYKQLFECGNYESLPMFESIFSFNTVWKPIIKCAPINTIDHMLNTYEFLTICNLNELYRLAISYGRGDVAELIKDYIKKF